MTTTTGEGIGDWASLGSEVHVSFFHDPMDEEALVATLSDFEVVASIRNTRHCLATWLEKLPNLRLLVTTGKTADVDFAYLREHGGDRIGNFKPRCRRTRLGVGGVVELGLVPDLADREAHGD